MLEQFTLYHGLAVLGAYLLGSIPTSVWIGKLFYDIDVREHGSGNAGATNTFRVLGKKAGIPVLLFDVLKGWLPVFLFPRLLGLELGTEAVIQFQVALGVLAVLGHIFPVYAGFKGGKGIATLLGVLFALHLQTALVCLGIFVVVFLTVRIVSVGSMLAGVSFPLVLVIAFKEDSFVLIGFAAVVAVLVLITHHKNIKRLLKGEEKRISFTKKKEAESG